MIDTQQLNRVIALALSATKRDTTGRAKRILLRLNHARMLTKHGFDGAAANAVFLARLGI